MDTAELEYELPSELIAQRPPERRDDSRLLVYDRATGEVRHRQFSELPEELYGELVVVNETRVIPARLRLERPGGGEAEVLEEHEIHTERYSVEPGEWDRIRAAERVLAVGTTTVRVLETLASYKLLQASSDPSQPLSRADRDASSRASNNLLQGRTGLFITPGYEFKRVDSLLTNFHLPRSTLLALVMAFAGVEETRRLYELAIAERYRFYSFGDAMLIR